MKLLLIDNYDSFTYNLEHYFKALDQEVTVLRNDEFELDELESFDLFVISPGPGLPKDAGKTMALIERYADYKAILGVCLGAQALAEYYGGELYNQKEVAHGISRTAVRKGESWLLNGLEPSFEVGLYHSWAIETRADFKEHFNLVAFRENGVLMAFEHPTKAIAGLQFHPESIMSADGRKILENWIRKAEARLLNQ